jgi:hypothetical protein
VLEPRPEQAAAHGDDAFEADLLLLAVHPSFHLRNARQTMLPLGVHQVEKLLAGGRGDGLVEEGIHKTHAQENVPLLCELHNNVAPLAQFPNCQLR